MESPLREVPLYSILCRNVHVSRVVGDKYVRALDTYMYSTVQTLPSVNDWVVMYFTWTLNTSIIIMATVRDPNPTMRTVQQIGFISIAGKRTKPYGATSSTVGSIYNWNWTCRVVKS